MKQNSISTVKARNRNLDLLRIISMLMVVTLHSFGWGGLLNDVTPAYGTVNWYLCQTVDVFSLVSVNCFVLISGYFLCTSKFKLKKWASIWVQTLFYSIGIYLIFAFVPSLSDGQVVFSIKGLIKSIMVFTTNRYWFVTAYLLLYAVFPILNFAIHAMNKRQHLLCCGVLLGIFSLLTNIVYFSDFTNIMGGSTVMWFCILYMVAAYFRLYVPERTAHQKWTFPIYILCSLAICGERFLAYAVTPYIFGDVKFRSLFYAKNSIMVAAASICLFQFFRGIKISGKTSGKTIGFVAPLTFAVYLIHDNVTLSSLLWDFIDLPSHADSPILIIYVLLVIAAIFVACCLIEWIRQQMFSKLKINLLINNTCDKIEQKVKLLLDKVEQ